MVTKNVLSEYILNPPSEPGRAKIDAAGPLYDLARVKALVEDETQLQLWTRKCINDVSKLFDSDLARVVELIQGLRSEDYIDSEWCENGKGFLAACDAYRCRRQEVVPGTSRPVTVEYYVKFAIGKTGRLVLVVSCHL